MLRHPTSRTESPPQALALIAWYNKNRRDLPWRRTRDPYAIWVSEVMLQQTQVQTVVPYFLRFMTTFPTVSDLARADLQQILKIWEGLGYYSRARNLHQAAGIIAGLSPPCIPDDPEQLRQLPGIGAYIAAAVLSIAFDQPFAVVDGNVKRVLARLQVISAPVNRSGSHPIFQNQADRLLDRRRPGDFNQAIMELGALVCQPRNPLCHQCPLAAFCRAWALDQVADFPKRTLRPPVPIKDLAAAAIWKRGRLLITRRPAQGLLGGLWELPTTDTVSGQRPETALLAHIHQTVGIDVRLTRPITVVKHAYTHFKIRMAVYECHWLKGKVQLRGPEAFHWISPDQVHDFPLPKAMAKAWPFISGLQP